MSTYAPIDPALKAEANKAFKLAFDAAEPGDKRRAAGKAFRYIVEGGSLEALRKVLEG